jgi:hypothetical protein
VLDGRDDRDDTERHRRRELIRMALTPIDHPHAAPALPGRGEVFVCPACHTFRIRISYGRVKSKPGEHTSHVIARIRTAYRASVVAAFEPHFQQAHPEAGDHNTYIRKAYNWDVL